MSKFYHSKEWGFDSSVIDKKIKAKQFLNNVGLSCCINAICDHSDVASIFANQVPNCNYLVMVYDKKTLRYTGFFDIVRYEQLQALIKPYLCADFHTDRLTYCFINQLYPCQGCFTANIISDGKGNALIEYLENTIDNRFLSSGGHYKSQPQRIRFNDYEMVYCDSLSVFFKLWDSFKICLFYDGYYECSYGISNGILGVFFSYYSNNKEYQNINLDYCESDSIKYRSIFLYLLANGII